MPQYRRDWIALSLTSLLFTAMLWGIMAIQQSEIREFRQDGILTEATVRDSVEKSEYSSSTSSSSIVYEMSVTFMDRSDVIEEETTIDLQEGEFDFGTIDVGEFQRATFKITRNSFNTINVGDTVEILYLPDDPSEAKLAEEVANWRPTFVQIFMGITIVVAVALFIKGLTAPPPPPKKPSEFPEWEGTS